MYRIGEKFTWQMHFKFVVFSLLQIKPMFTVDLLVFYVQNDKTVFEMWMEISKWKVIFKGFDDRSEGYYIVYM